MPAVQAARAGRPIPMHRRAARGIPGERFLPWPQPASTAMICGRLPLAMTAVAGPSLVLPKPASLNPGYQPGSHRPVPDDHAAKKNRRGVTCFTKRAGRIVLTLRNDRENLPIIVRPDSRHRHRLRLDSGRHRSDPDCADLPHFDLDQRRDRAPEAAFLDGYARTAKRFSRAALFGYPYTQRGASPRFTGKIRQAPMHLTFGIHTRRCVNRA
jgi:hypothetical protein